MISTDFYIYKKVGYVGECLHIHHKRPKLVLTRPSLTKGGYLDIKLLPHRDNEWV